MMREKQSYRLLFDEGEAIKGCTSSGSEISRLVASPVPYAGVEEGDKDWLLDESKAEKCNFCEQRRKQNEDPYCVHMCPANARIWGDIDDDDSDAAKVLKQQDARVSHPEYGTSPSVFYIGAFS
jgi:molybdopterin-containing oxidoreductase family iron-sulfur binding subunit